MLFLPSLVWKTAASKLMTATLVVPVGVIAGAAAGCATALRLRPAMSRHEMGNEREITRFMWIKNSSGLDQISRACGSEPRFLIYLLRCSWRRIPSQQKPGKQDESRSEDILRN